MVERMIEYKIKIDSMGKELETTSKPTVNRNTNIHSVLGSSKIERVCVRERERETEREIEIERE